MSRWVTFDCYGTLIDWNSGIGDVLEHLFGAERAPALLARYRLEPEVQAESYRSYAEVLSLTLERLAADAGPRFPRATPAPSPTRCPTGRLSARCRRPGRAPPPRLEPGDPLQHRPRPDHGVAEGARRADRRDRHGRGRASYKPAHGHWERFFELTTAEKARHVHVAASFHDAAPARELGLKTVWINRLGEVADPEPASCPTSRRCRTRSTSSSA